MSFILVCASDSSCRRLYVDNLVMRGYLAVGTASVVEAHRLLEHEVPHVIIVCCLLDGQDEVVTELRDFEALDATPIVLVSPEVPDREWMNLWGVVACLPYPTDLRKLVQLLQPWLVPIDGSVTLHGQTARHTEFRNTAV